MRGYGIPQATFALECSIEDAAYAAGMDPIEFRYKNLMPVGYTDPFSKNVYRQDSIRECVQKCKDYIGWDKKRALYAKQAGNIRRGVGMALFWYNTAVWPISLESSSCRMVLNQDGSIQMQLSETEIGQGADTVFSQMAADTVGIPIEKVHIVSTQDTDVAPFGTGAYGSRQSYVGGHAVKKCGTILREKMLKRAAELNCSFEEVGLRSLYTMGASEHITAEATAEVESNAYSFGCSFAEIEVDIALAKIRVLELVNAHDAGALLNPALAEAQAHGGMSMGLGYALGERCQYDEKTGRMLNGTFLDYKIGTTMDHPKMKVFFVEYPEPTSAFGNKALGEPPATSPAPAIRNALIHATGVAVNELPLSPHALYPAFRRAGLYS
jgi:xanthine dehydrogenase molybdenum-binding subunit